MTSNHDEALRLLGADTLLGHLTSLQVQLPGVLANEDIECVHKTRVASRRIRSALGLFGPCFGKRAKGWARAIRRITRALSPARDLDVQLDFLDTFSKKLTKTGQRPGIQRLTLRLRQQRQAMQAKVAKEVMRLQASATLEEMAMAMQQVRVDAEMRGLPARSQAIFSLALDRLAGLLQAALLFEPFVIRPECMEQLHDMRIAFKRLRYTLEAFAPAYAGGLADYVQHSKDIQTILGDIHDCDVWLEILPGFLQDERQRTIAYFGHARPFRRIGPGIEALQTDRQRRRHDLYQQFLTRWREIRERDTWGHMLQLLSQGALE